MKMFAWLQRNAVLRPFEAVVKGRKTFHYWRKLEETQWLPRAELERRQLESLRRLLEHAQRHCPYYRREWDRQGLDPRRVGSLADLRTWPLLTKETIRAHRAEMRAELPDLRMLSKATGGSGGVPLHFDLDMESHERRTAAMYRGYAWAGAGTGNATTVPLGGRPRRSVLVEAGQGPTVRPPPAAADPQLVRVQSGAGAAFPPTARIATART